MPPVPSTRAPKALTALGVLLLLGAVALVVVGVVLVARTLPTGVLGPGGTPGPDVVAVVDAPGTAEVRLEAGAHQVWLVTSGTAGDAGLAGDVRVVGPDGEEVRVRQGWLSGRTSGGGTVAHAVAGFDVATAGTHTIEAPAADDGAQARLHVTPDDGAAAFVGGILGTVGVVMASLVLGAIGLGIAVGGGIWWYRRAHPPAVSPR